MRDGPLAGLLLQLVVTGEHHGGKAGPRHAAHSLLLAAITRPFFVLLNGGQHLVWGSSQMMVLLHNLKY